MSQGEAGVGEEPDHQVLALADSLNALRGRISDLSQGGGRQVRQLHVLEVGPWWGAAGGLQVQDDELDVNQRRAEVVQGLLNCSHAREPPSWEARLLPAHSRPLAGDDMANACSDQASDHVWLTSRLRTRREVDVRTITLSTGAAIGAEGQTSVGSWIGSRSTPRRLAPLERF